jgi:Mg2+/Co2+ transporter CorB
MNIEVLLVLVVLLGLSALFSLIEVAFLSINPIQVDAFIKQKRFGSKSLKTIKANPRQAIITLLFCNTLVNFSAVSLASIIFLVYFPQNGILISTIVMTIIILLFGQILPKVVGEQYAARIILFLSRPTQALIVLLRPLTFVFEWVSKKIPFAGTKETSPEEFVSMLRFSRKGGVISKKSETLINNLIEFQYLTAEDIVTPQPQVKLFASTFTIKKAISVAKKFPHTHFPVYKDRETNIIGVVSTASLLKYSSKPVKLVSSILEETYTVPDIKNAEELLLDLEEKGDHVSVVVDEYGTFIGIITKEDILRRFLGRIPVSEIPSKKKIIFPGDTPVSTIEDRFSTKSFQTKRKSISGLIEEKLQYIPVKGEEVSINGLTFTILEATKTKILTVKIVD